MDDLMATRSGRRFRRTRWGGRRLDEPESAAGEIYGFLRRRVGPRCTEGGWARHARPQSAPPSVPTATLGGLSCLLSAEDMDRISPVTRKPTGL